jgi:integrase
MSGSGGLTFKRCGCRDPRTGRQLGRRCPHLRKRGHGSWYLAVELSAAPDGRRRRVRLGGYATRAAAQAALGRLGKPGGPPRRGAAGCTTGQWLAAWLAGRQSLRPLTRRSYQHHLDTYLLPCIGNIPLAMLTAADLRVMFTAIARQRPAAGGPLSPATLARIRATLRAALNAAIREGLISVNPARLVELPAPARPHPVVWTAPREAAWREAGVRPAVAVWTAGQTARFLTAIRGEPLYPCYQLMAVSGLRRGEAAGLRWCDVDFAGTTLTVSRQLQETSRGLVLLPPKSIAGNRVLALDPWTLQVLAAHRGRQRLPAGCDGYVFARPGGRPYPPGYLTRRFAMLVRREGLPPIRLHDLRHGAATLALASGADLKVIQAMLGHASIILTADTYTSVLPDLARATAEAVAAQILKAARTPPASPRPHPGLTRQRHDHRRDA